MKITLKRVAAVLISVMVSAVLTGCDNQKQNKNDKEEIQQNKESQRLVGMSFKLSRGFESSMGGSMGMSAGGGYQYEMKIEIGNPNAHPFTFDTIELSYTNGLGKDFDGYFGLTGQSIVLTKTGVCTFYHYGKEHNSERLFVPGDKSDEHKLESEILEKNKAVGFHCSMASSLMPTVCGKSMTIVNATMMSNDKAVSGLYRAVLPPLMKIPDSFRMASREDGLKLYLMPILNLPAPSGTLKSETIDSAFKKALTVAPDAKLIKIAPEVITRSSYSQGPDRLFPEGWRYSFWSSSGCFDIPSIDTSAVQRKENAEYVKPIAALDKEILKKSIVDCDAVAMMIEVMDFDCPHTKGGKFELIAALSDGNHRPIWTTGYAYDGKNIYVFADTAQVVYREGESFKPFSGIIWNE